MAPTERLRAALAGAEGVVFVCSGNMVRSAFAELYARHRGLALAVRSVATTYRNDFLFPQTAAALRARGVPETAIAAFRPTHVDDARESFGERWAVLGMTDEHLAAVASLPGPKALLSEARGARTRIADPVLEGADFGRTFEEVAACVDALAAWLATERP